MRTMIPFLYGAAVVLMSIDTGGGGAVGGNVEAGKDFTGRDRVYNNYYNDDPQNNSRRKYSIEERLDDLERTMYGNERSGEAGIVKNQRTNRLLLQVNTAITVIGIVLILWKIY